MAKSPRIPRGRHGSLKLVEDTSGKPCFCCGGDKEVLFLLVSGGRKVGELYLRICSACLQVIGQAHRELRAPHSGG